MAGSRSNTSNKKSTSLLPKAVLDFFSDFDSDATYIEIGDNAGLFGDARTLRQNDEVNASYELRDKSKSTLIEIAFNQNRYDIVIKLINCGANLGPIQDKLPNADQLQQIFYILQFAYQIQQHLIPSRANYDSEIAAIKTKIKTLSFTGKDSIVERLDQLTSSSNKSDVNNLLNSIIKKLTPLANIITAYNPNATLRIDGLPEIQMSDLTHKLAFGNGANGTVIRCEYTGEDEEIKKICKHADEKYWLVLKLANDPLSQETLDEANLATKLAEKQTDPVASPYNYARGATLTFDDTERRVIVCQLETLDNKLESSDAKLFLEKQVRFFRPDSSDTRAMTHDLDILAGQIVLHAGKSIHSMHEAGFLHLDLMPENSLISAIGDDNGTKYVAGVKVCDYGFAREMSDGQYTFKEDESIRGNLPRISQERMGIPRIATPISDMYAYRMYILECISLVVGKNYQFPLLGIKDPASADPVVSQAANYVFHHGDQETLNKYVEYMKKELPNALNVSQENIEMATLMLNAYMTFITEPDVDNATDYRNLEESHIVYFISCLNKKIEDYDKTKDAQRLHIGLTRLMHTPINETLLSIDEINLITDIKNKLASCDYDAIPNDYFNNLIRSTRDAVVELDGESTVGDPDQNDRLNVLVNTMNDSEDIDNPELWLAYAMKLNVKSGYDTEPPEVLKPFIEKYNLNTFASLLSNELVMSLYTTPYTVPASCLSHLVDPDNTNSDDDKRKNLQEILSDTDNLNSLGENPALKLLAIAVLRSDMFDENLDAIATKLKSYLSAIPSAPQAVLPAARPILEWYQTLERYKRFISDTAVYLSPDNRHEILNIENATLRNQVTEKLREISKLYSDVADAIPTKAIPVISTEDEARREAIWLFENIAKNNDLTVALTNIAEQYADINTFLVNLPEMCGTDKLPIHAIYNLDIGSLAIMPIQLGPKFPLLTREIINTKLFSYDESIPNSALDECKSLVKTMNDAQTNIGICNDRYSIQETLCELRQYQNNLKQKKLSLPYKGRIDIIDKILAALENPDTTWSHKNEMLLAMKDKNSREWAAIHKHIRPGRATDAPTFLNNTILKNISLPIANLAKCENTTSTLIPEDGININTIRTYARINNIRLTGDQVKQLNELDTNLSIDVVKSTLKLFGFNGLTDNDLQSIYAEYKNKLPKLSPISAIKTTELIKSKFKETLQSKYDELLKTIRNPDEQPPKNWRKSSNDNALYEKYKFHTYKYTDPVQTKPDSERHIVVRVYDKDAYGLTTIEDYLDRAALPFDAILNETKIKELDLDDKFVQWAKIQKHQLEKYLHDVDFPTPEAISRLSDDEKLKRFNKVHDDILAAIKQTTHNLAVAISTHLKPTRKLSESIALIKQAEKDFILNSGRPTIIHLAHIDDNPGGVLRFSAQFPQSELTVPSTIRSRKGMPDLARLSNHVLDIHGRIKGGKVTAAMAIDGHSSFPSTAKSDSSVERFQLANEAVLESIATAAKNIQKSNPEKTLGASRDQPLPVSMSTMMLLTPRTWRLAEKAHDLFTKKKESEALQVETSKLAIQAVLASRDPNGVIELKDKKEEKSTFVKLDYSFMNMPVNVGKPQDKPPLALSVAAENLADAALGKQPKKPTFSFSTFLRTLNPITRPETAQSSLTEKINAKGFYEHCVSIEKYLSSNLASYVAIPHTEALFMSDARAEIKRLNRELSDIDKQLREKLATLSAATSDWRLASIKSDIARLEKAQNDIYANIEIMNKDQFNHVLQQPKIDAIKLAISAELPKYDVGSKIRDDLLLLDRYIKIQDIYYNEKFKNAPYIYEIPVLYLQTSDYIGHCTETFCKSGEDRTGWLRISLQAHTEFYLQFNRDPDFNTPEDQRTYTDIIREVHPTSASLANTRENSRARGMQIESALTTESPMIKAGKNVGKIAKTIFDVDNLPLSSVLIPADELGKIRWEPLLEIINKPPDDLNPAQKLDELPIKIGKNESATFDDIATAIFLHADNNDVIKDIPALIQAAAAYRMLSLTTSKENDNAINLFKAKFNQLEPEELEVFQNSLPLDDVPNWQAKEYLSGEYEALAQLRELQERNQVLKRLAADDGPLALMAKGLKDLAPTIAALKPKPVVGPSEVGLFVERGKDAEPPKPGVMPPKPGGHNK